MCFSPFCRITPKNEFVYVKSSRRSHTSPIDMIRRAENVEPSKPRASGRSAGTSLSIGMAGTVENARRKSPETKLGKKSRYQAFRKIAPQQHQKQSRAGRSQTIEPSGRPQGTSSENARGTNFRPSLSLSLIHI